MKTAYRFTHRKGHKIQVTFRHIPGRWFTTGTDKMVEAIKFAESKLHETQTNRGRIPTIREFAQGFFIDDRYGYRVRNEKRNLMYKEDFYRSHEGRLNNYVIPAFGDYLLNSISDVMVEDWFLELISVESGKELADNSKNKVLTTLKIVLDEAKRLRIIENNPVSSVNMINEVNKRREPFTLPELGIMFPTDENELMRIWGTRLWAVYFLIMRDTGFRPGEVAALTKDSYVPQFRGVYTECSVDALTRKIQQSIKTTNKGQGYKVGILTKQTMEQLNELIFETKGEYLFLSINGKLFRPEVPNKHMKASCVRAGIEVGERTQYSLRHSFETNLSGKIAGKDMLELMAHTSYHGEYDHRTPHQILAQLQPIGDVLDTLA